MFIFLKNSHLCSWIHTVNFWLEYFLYLYACRPKFIRFVTLKYCDILYFCFADVTNIRNSDRNMQLFDTAILTWSAVLVCQSNKGGIFILLLKITNRPFITLYKHNWITWDCLSVVEARAGGDLHLQSSQQAGTDRDSLPGTKWRHQDVGLQNGKIFNRKCIKHIMKDVVIHHRDTVLLRVTSAGMWGNAYQWPWHLAISKCLMTTKIRLFSPS